MSKNHLFLYGVFLANLFPLMASATTPTSTVTSTQSISSNIAAQNIPTGTGFLQQYIEKELGIKNNHGIQFSGAWLGDENDLFSGGTPQSKQWTSNSLLLAGMTIDTKQLMNLDGGLFGVQFLQFNGQNTNGQAGSVQGYNSLPGASPLNRSELYQLWYRQTLFDNKLIIRIGKQLPNDTFNNVIKPVPLAAEDLSLPAVTSLLYTPIFVNTSMLGVIPGYYNSAYGATVTFAPIKQWYFSYGTYDGSIARGVQTGLTGPNFNGSYFHIGETGVSWLLGKEHKPGNIAVGVWHQTGPIEPGSSPVSENGASGYYLFGTQRVWYHNPGIDDSGISVFYQYGKNDSNVLSMHQYMGAGFTAAGLVPHRKDDSIGFGTSLSWLNQNKFDRTTELMYQAYYQAVILKFLYLEPAITYIPTPGEGKDLPAAWAGTIRLILLF